MQIRMKNAAGGLLFLYTAHAAAQGTSATTSATVASAASTPPGTNVTQIPSDPTWFIAGLVTGLLVGAIGAKVFGGSKSTAG